MTRLESLLQENYMQLHGEEGKNAALDYLRNHASVGHEEPVFIKKLLKVVNHILHSDPASLETLLYKAHRFAMEGIDKIRNGHPHINPDKLPGFKSSFCMYAGDAAMAIFEKTGSISWLQMAYHNYWKSADSVKESNEKHAAHAYSFAAKAARIILEHIGESKSEKLLWAERSYNANMESIKHTLISEPIHAAHCFAFAGNAARIKFEITKDPQDAQNWYDAYEKSASKSADVDPRHSGYAYSFAGQAARELYKVTGKISLAEESYFAYKKSAEIISLIDPKYSSHASMFAGQIARIVYLKTNNQEWAKKAVRAYESFLKYSASNPDPKQSDLILEIKSSAAELERHIAAHH